jgi:hypothetical protein
LTVKSAQRTSTLFVLVGTLALATIGVRFAASAKDSFAARPIPIPSFRQSDGYVRFHVEWIPGDHPEDVTFDNLTVNGQRYVVDKHPTLKLIKPILNVPQGYWDSPPLPNKLPRGQATAHLDIKVERPAGYTGQVWTGCYIEINGPRADGYDSLVGATLSKYAKKTTPLLYRCQTLPAG